LALLHRHPTSADHEKVLTAWYTERKQQLERSLAATIRNGEYVTESDPVKVFVREWYMWAIQLIPSVRREVQLGARAGGMARYKHGPGLPFVAEMGGGLLLPQVYAYDWKADRLQFTDDLIFSPQKQGLFQLLVLPDTVQEIVTLTQGLSEIDELSRHLLHSDEATILVQSTQASLPTPTGLPSKQNLARLATGDEFAADPVLCKNRPPPIGYDEFRLKREVQGRKFVILRNDRFVFAACDTPAELKEAARRLASDLSVEF
jgi:hypothetical protein